MTLSFDELWWYHFYGYLKVKITRYSKNFSVAVNFPTVNSTVTFSLIVSVVFDVFFQCFQFNISLQRIHEENCKAEAMMPLQKTKTKNWIVIRSLDPTCLYLYIQSSTLCSELIIGKYCRHTVHRLLRRYDLYTKAVLKNEECIPYTTIIGTCGLRGEIAFAWWTRCGLVWLVVEVRRSPTCAFLSCCAGREMKYVFVVEILRLCQRAVHPRLCGRGFGELVSFCGCWVLSGEISAQKKAKVGVVHIERKMALFKAPIQYFSVWFPGAATRRSTNSNQCAKLKAVFCLQI